ncbi:MAG: tripartite tricarboxylate transporter substrate binding protein [Deltaproteobacteria bacterium]|nr:tripartite tricarboxylate transporter substrate binding protein [Deltaproteobacteria bacterium]
MKSKVLCMAMAAVLSLVFAGLISAQGKYPVKTITIITHTAAGSPTDLMARQLARAAEPLLGQTVVVQNKPGGSSAMQMAALLSAPADGYTLATVTPTQIGALEGPLKGQFNIDQFSWITCVEIDPYVIVVQAGSPWKTLKDLVDYGKKNPNKLRVGGFGSTGSGHNVAFNIFSKAADFKTVWMPYEGTNAAVIALLGGHIDVANSNPGQVAQHVEAGKLRILGVMAPKRLPDFPHVPTYAEAGYQVEEGWDQFRGILGRSGIPKPIQIQLSDIFLKAIKSAPFQDYLKKTQMEDGSMGTEEFAAFVKKQSKLTVHWYRELGIIK